MVPCRAPCKPRRRPRWESAPRPAAAVTGGELDFAVDQYIVIGSPLGLFLALRKVLCPRTLLVLQQSNDSAAYICILQHEEVVMQGGCSETNAEPLAKLVLAVACRCNTLANSSPALTVALIPAGGPGAGDRARHPRRPLH